MIDIAKMRQLAPDKLLKGSKIFYDDLSEPGFRISHQQFTRIVDNLNKYLPHSDIAFLLGSRLYPNHLGAGGQALAYAKNLKDILIIVKKFHCQFFPFLFMRQTSTKKNQYLLFNQAISIEKPSYYQFICELFASLVMFIAKQRSLPLSRIALRFPYTTPHHIEQYHAYLPCKFNFAPCASLTSTFGSQSNYLLPLQVKFDNGLLSFPLENDNFTLMKHYLKKAPPQSANIGFVHYIMQLMTKRIERKQEVNADWLAAHLKMSNATLKRKLAQHNVSYQQMFDLIRQQQAVFLLTEQNFNNEKVAQDLNFSDITNFRRSFKRWTGFTPKALKKAY